MMRSKRFTIRIGLMLVVVATLCSIARSQEVEPEEEFGPVVRAYLGYLHDEQEVVDDRASRREITTRYYRRNSNRIRALREIAVNIARETNNDYLPELEAATRDEFKTLFEKAPNPRTFRVGQVLNNTFRYLGSVRTGEVFYIFARLDPYEQAELMEKAKTQEPASDSQSVSTTPAPSENKITATPPRHNSSAP